MRLHARRSNFSTVRLCKDDAAAWASGALGRYGLPAASAQSPDLRAYVDEPGVDAARRTETYAAMRLEFASWRWAGVPFYVRTGKRMARKLTEVVVQFRTPPLDIFEKLGATVRNNPGNQLILNIAPDEGISLRVAGKVPGSGLTIATTKLEMDYVERFGGEPPEAYGPLILDAVKGDRTLYKHRDEVENGWRIVEPFLNSERLREGIETYPGGSWGPMRADAILAAEDAHWHNPQRDSDVR